MQINSFIRQLLEQRALPLRLCVVYKQRRIRLISFKVSHYSSDSSGVGKQNVQTEATRNANRVAACRCMCCDPVSVCLSVCLSVTSWCPIETSERIALVFGTITYLGLSNAVL